MIRITLALPTLLIAVLPAGEAPPEPVRAALGDGPGLVVQIGAVDGSLATGLATRTPAVIAAVPGDPAAAAALRERLSRAGVHGQATVVATMGTRIPLDDALADVVVEEPTAGLPRAESLRILRPGGTLVAQVAGSWTATVKPRPADIDDWGQHNHDAAGTNASRDAQVGPGRSLRWLSGPQSRTTYGQLICDRFAFTVENPGDNDNATRLVMRNAFNGLVLWERTDIPCGGGFDTKYANILTRDRLYLLPGRIPGYGPLTLPDAMLVLDPATGRTIQTLDQGIRFPQRQAIEAIADKAERQRISDQAKIGHANAMAVLSDDGRHLLQVAGKEAVLLDARTGARLWRLTAAEGANFAWPIISGGNAYVIEGPWVRSTSYTHWPMVDVRRIRAVDLVGGGERWAWSWPADRPSGAAINILAAGGRLALNLRTPAEISKSGGAKAALLCLDLGRGTESYWGVNTPLMKGEYGGHSGSRLLAVGDRWWFTTIGQVLGTAPMSDPGTLQFPGYRHSRPVGCTTFRATPNWIFGNLTGYPLDPSGPNAPIEHSAAARNSCDVGSFPANGLLYLGPNHCFCYPYVPGSTAFDSERFPGAQDADRLVRGSAAPAPAKTDSAAWPMQLATPDRRNWTADAIPAVLEPLWTAQPSGTRPAEALDRNWSAHFFAQGPVTGLSIGEGTAVGAISHRQEVVALDPATGGERWRAALDGRIDTQPTIHRGLVLAGTANGYVYALNRDTGSLVWRFRAAPLEQRIVVDGQLESPWPAHGAITVDGDLVYAMAGRHSDADGGLWLWVLDARSGAERSRQRIGQDELHPTVNVYPQWNPKDLPKVAGPVGSNLPVLTPGHLLIPGASFARAGDRLEPWTIPQAEPGEWGGWRARFEFGFLTPGNQGLMNRYHNLNGYMLSQYGGTSGRIFAVNGDDFVNLGATITTQHRGGGGGDQIVRLHRQKDWERLTKDGKPANAYRGSQPVWEGPARPRTGSTAMAVAGDAVLVAHATPPVLEVLALADGVSRQRIVLPAPAIANGISSDDGRVYLSLIDGTVMAFGKR